MAATKRPAGRAVREIIAAFKGFDRKTPAEQMATYFTVGRALRAVVEDEATYGARGTATVASQVPQLGTEDRADLVMRMADLADRDDIRDFILSETAVPMDDGQPLTLGHWRWVFRACSPGRPAGNEERYGGELAWLRRESPSEEVLGHVAQVLDAEHMRELEELREQAREACRLLDAL